MVEILSLSTEIFVVEDVTACDEQLSLELEKYPYEVLVLGLDCEWVTQDRQQEAPVCPVALLQLAFPNGKCFLVRLCRMNGRLPGKLRDILEDRNVLKVGVGIGEDGRKLSQCYGVVVQGCIDLRHVTSRCRAYVHHCFGEDGLRDNMSLSSLSQQILGVTLDKDWKIRCSNWEAESLSKRQIEYAANDAMVAEHIFFMLLASKLQEKEDRFERAGSSNPDAEKVFDDILCSQKDLSNSQKTEKDLLLTIRHVNENLNDFLSVDAQKVGEIQKDLQDPVAVVKSQLNKNSSEITSDLVSEDFLCTSVDFDKTQEMPKDFIPVTTLSRSSLPGDKNTSESTPDLVSENLQDFLRTSTDFAKSQEMPKDFIPVNNVSRSSLGDKNTSESTPDLISENLQDLLICTSDNLNEAQKMENDLQDPISNSSLKDKTSPPASKVGILSGFMSKLRSNFSFESIIGSQSKVSEKPKAKVYRQYTSFQKLDMTTTGELLSSRDIWDCLSPLCQGIVDLPYKTKTKNKNYISDKTGQTSSPKVVKASGLKPRRCPLYQNCVLEAPDGEMLSTCDKRKAEWYLVRELADVVKEDPYTVRLRFEPSGRPLDPEHNYYLTFKENMCVVCGRDDSYMRKNIIPHDYRKHFPVCMKDHHSHDVLLLCPPCHMISCNHDDLLRRRLAKQYDAPLASAQVARLIQDPVLKRVKSAAKALVHAGEKIPEKRLDELRSQVREFLGVEHPTREMLIEAAGLETRRENCDFISHGREVVGKMKDADMLLGFERMWREHFLATMKPKYLPPLWTVDHEQEKVRRLLEKELNEHD